MEKKQKKGLDISVRSFVTAIAVIFVLMVLTYLLTLFIPGGEYARTVDASGNTVIDTSSGFTYTEGGISFLRWIASPVLVLGASGGGTLIAVIIFLLVIGGVFNSIDKCGLMQYMLGRIVARFGSRRYTLQAVVMLFFMAMGSLMGSFEETIPLVPIVTALAVRLGWDALTGMGMSLLAVGCGFAAGVANPFSVGVAQKLAGLPMFSGMGFRALGFVLIYALLFLFVRTHAKRVERPCENTQETAAAKDPKLSRALVLFAGCLGTGILLVLSSIVITALQDYTMIIIAFAFLIGGIAASLAAGSGWKGLGTMFANGALSILPAVLMILMASSIKYTLEESKVLDTILHAAVGAAGSMPRAAVILFIYLIALVMNFFISSGSAKAFLLIPLVVPLAQIFGIPAQLCVLAYAFGDGFSNVFYPTNPALLIALGLVNVSYVDWAKWSWKFQAANLVLTSGLLLLGLAVGYC